MTDDAEARTWTDRDDTRWDLEERDARGDRPPRTVFRSTTYAFVAFVPAEAHGGEEGALQALVDRHMGRAAEGERTARLWTDPRSGTEWEVEVDAGELVFWSGTEAVRAPWGDGREHPRDMGDHALAEALDAAQAPD